ncbi:MAG TPA: hypothetical protein ENK57_00770 [Polyangiaceae bacterium]|nr:hypothetical protein [Polyangiaceae bacterium]
MTSRDDHEVARDADLRALFSAHRPDPDAFAAGVAERLAEQSGDGPAEVERGAVAGRSVYRRLLDRAAGVLPGWKLTGTGKPWLSVVFVPLGLFIGTLVAFVLAFRGVDPNAHDAARPAGAGHRFGNRMLLGLLPMFGSLLGIVLIVWSMLFGGGHLPDVITLVFLVAMLLLSGHIATEARSGVVSGVRTGRVVVLLLLAMLYGTVLWLGGRGAAAGEAAFGRGAIGWILLAGVVGAILLTWRAAGECDAALGVLLGLSLPLGAISLPLPAFPVGRLAASLAHDDLEPERLAGWSAAELAARAIEQAGAEIPAMPATRERLLAALAAPPERARDDHVHPQVWTTAVALGLLDADELRTLAQRPGIRRRLDGLLHGSGPVAVRGYDAFLLDCLLARQSLSVGEREQLAERIVRGWPQPEQPGAIEVARSGARWLERLGQLERLQAARGPLRELLRRHWVGVDAAPSWSVGGGFAELAASSGAKVAVTVEAVELMRYVGVPEAIRLRQIDGYLRSQRHVSAIGRLITAGDRRVPVADAGLVLLRRGLGLPERSWFEFLLAERCAIAAVLLVLLGLRAILVADRAERSVRGALP